MDIIYSLDLAGTFAFAVYGAYVGISKEFDIIGVFLCAFLCAVGGGTIREFILGNVPFYFHNTTYILVIVAGIAFSIVTFRVFSHVNTAMLIVDAIGLATFAFIGAQKAAEANLGLFGMMLLSALTAAGGGILRDIVVNEVPLTLKTDLYISPALVASFFYWLLGDARTLPWVTVMFMLFVFAARTYALFYKVQLWQPKHSNIHDKLWKHSQNARLPTDEEPVPV